MPTLIPALGQMGEHPLEMDWPDLPPEFQWGRGEEEKQKADGFKTFQPFNLFCRGNNSTEKVRVSHAAQRGCSTSRQPQPAHTLRETPPPTFHTAPRDRTTRGQPFQAAGQNLSATAPVENVKNPTSSLTLGLLKRNGESWRGTCERTPRYELSCERGAARI